MSIPESEWLRRAQQGDNEAFNTLVEIYHRRVYNLCYRMLGNAMEAEDAAQETFIRAYGAIKRYDPERPFLNWVLTIASRYCIDQHRRRRLPTFSIETRSRPQIPDLSAGPEAVLVAEEERHALQAILQSLSPTDRAAIVMFYWYDFSYQEIAVALSLTVSAVKSRLHRARKKLATGLLELERKESQPERSKHGSPAF